MTLPNILTIARMIGAFVFLYFSALENWSAAFLIFCAAAATDLVDGSIARLLRQRTSLGAFLDPMADKLLMFFGFMTLTSSGFLPVYLTALVVARDLFIVLGLRYLISQKASIRYEPTFLSKTTTCFQIVTLFASLMTTQPRFAAWAARPDIHLCMKACLHATTALTALTFVQYYRIGLGLLRQARATS